MFYITRVKLDAVVSGAVAEANCGNYSSCICKSTLNIHRTGGSVGCAGYSLSIVSHNIGSIGVRSCAIQPADGNPVCATASSSCQATGWTGSCGSIDETRINTFLVTFVL